jgi:hypothetical protein
MLTVVEILGWNRECDPSIEEAVVGIVYAAPR